MLPLALHLLVGLSVALLPIMLGVAPKPALEQAAKPALQAVRVQRATMIATGFPATVVRLMGLAVLQPMEGGVPGRVGGAAARVRVGQLARKVLLQPARIRVLHAEGVLALVLRELLAPQ